MTHRSRTLALVCFAALLALAAQAEVTLPALLSDHGVLQRDAPIHIWGTADPGEQVTVSFHAQKQTTVADDLGKWSVYLLPEHAGGPYQLTVRGSSTATSAGSETASTTTKAGSTGANAITISDLLVGDVWFASGQSNMEFPLNGFPGNAVLKNGPQEIAAANHPQIRLLHIAQKSSPYPLATQDATWSICTPETAASFSAVAYFFGRELQQRLQVPIGLIDSTWGGTPAEAWVSLDGLSRDAALMPVFRARTEMTDAQADVPAMLAREKREDAAAKAANQKPPQHSWHPNPASWEPAGLYNGMVAPAVPFTIKGVIWYQGESNSGTERASMYTRVFSTLISDWRAHWGEGNFPFLFVQISSFTSSPQEHWGILRDAQRRTLDLTDTAMAVTLDIGQPDNVHPPDKQTVGARLALAARALAYNQAVEYSGPLFREATPEITPNSGSMRIWFSHADDGLKASGAGALEGFEIAGADHHFVPATARIDSATQPATVVVSAAELKSPRYVRYAWANAPVANLYNGAGLPASTFISEQPPPEPCPEGCER